MSDSEDKAREILNPLLSALTSEARDLERYSSWQKDKGAAADARAEMIKAGERIIAELASALDRAVDVREPTPSAGQ